MPIDLRQLDLIKENTIINRISAMLPRASGVMNSTHESDSEIVDIGLANMYLALTTDCVAEEIEFGLYKDPELMGWMCVVVNLSDLAAVGARPLGVLLSTTVSSEWTDDFIERIVKGMAEACLEHQCGSFGGDFNIGEPALGATAVGLVSKESVMFRTGMGDGDIMFLTGLAGIGGAQALAVTAAPELLENIHYKPCAKTREAQIISKYASSCMDTSDGLIFTLDQLVRLNNVDIHLEDINSITHPVAIEIAEACNLSPLHMLCAIHGEFELCFTIPETRIREFQAEMGENSFHAIKIGQVHTPIRKHGGVIINNRPFPTGTVRNLWTNRQSVSNYIRELTKLIDTVI